MTMPPDPWSKDLDDFLPMATNAFKMYQAAVMAGFTPEQAMEWMIRITSSMINENIKRQGQQ